MKVTRSVIRICDEVNHNTKYIVYFPGNAEDVNRHTDADWGWCDKNTFVDLCNYPHHSEWHNPNVLGYSKFRYTVYNAIALIAFIPVIATLYLFTPLALAISASVGLLVTMLFINSTIVRSNVKFYTRGEDSVAVGVKRVLDLLDKGVHPDNIILQGFSIGGGVAAEVYKRFKSERVHLRCQILNSFSSIRDLLIDTPVGEDGRKPWIIKLVARLGKLVAPLLKIVHWDIETYKIIDSITPYTVFFNTEGDQIIAENVQLSTKVRSVKKSNKTTDKIFELLFKKHTILTTKFDVSLYRNTHCVGMSRLQSKESHDIGAEGLQYLFTYLPYHMDVLRSEVENLSANNEKIKYANQTKNNLAQILRKVLEGSADEVKELQELLDNLQMDEGKCLDKNTDYRKERLQKLNSWVKKYNVSFVDLDDSLDSSSCYTRNGTFYLG